ncbi:MAG: VOC family protein [Gammaproteobacteria bacterium]|nr:VOC family protein [Gammaproteobacteria bacterium]
MTKVQIDHIMWGAPDLDAGISEAQRLFGVEAARGGSHPGLGTRNALLSLGEGVYLEIIAPDPRQPLEGTFGERLLTLDGCEIITWAASSADLSALSLELAGHGLACRGPVRTQRATPEGDLLTWDLLFPDAPGYAGTFPFFINWLETPHPATGNPPAGSFRALTIGSPRAVELATTLTSLGLEVAVQEGAPAIAVEIDVGGSTITLESTPKSIDLRMP